MLPKTADGPGARRRGPERHHVVPSGGPLEERGAAAESVPGDVYPVWMSRSTSGWYASKSEESTDPPGGLRKNRVVRPHVVDVHRVPVVRHGVRVDLGDREGSRQSGRTDRRLVGGEDPDVAGVDHEDVGESPAVAAREDLRGADREVVHDAGRDPPDHRVVDPRRRRRGRRIVGRPHDVAVVVAVQPEPWKGLDTLAAGLGRKEDAGSRRRKALSIRPGNSTRCRSRWSCRCRRRAGCCRRRPARRTDRRDSPASGRRRDSAPPSRVATSRRCCRSSPRRGRACSSSSPTGIAWKRITSWVAERSAICGWRALGVSGPLSIATGAVRRTWLRVVSLFVKSAPPLTAA